MLNLSFKSFWPIAAWFAVVITMVAASIALHANLSTTVLLLACAIAPAIIVWLLAYAEPSPTVAQILHSVDAKDGRS